MAEAALKIEPFTMSVRRVGLPDLQDKGRFLCEELKAHWPHLQDRSILGWLQGISGSNEYLFIRSDKAFGLFQRMQEFIEPYPWVKEIFVLAEQNEMKLQPGPDADHVRIQNEMALEQAFGLYDDAKRWMESIRASRIEFGPISPFEVKDKDPENKMTLKAKFGRLFERTLTIYKIGS
jgi:hypothetical protein